MRAIHLPPFHWALFNLQSSTYTTRHAACGDLKNTQTRSQLPFRFASSTKTRCTEKKKKTANISAYRLEKHFFFASFYCIVPPPLHSLLPPPFSSSPLHPRVNPTLPVSFIPPNPPSPPPRPLFFHPSPPNLRHASPTPL